MQTVRLTKNLACLAIALSTLACGGSKSNTRPTQNTDAQSGNKVVTVKPEAYSATKYAIVSYFGNRAIPTKGLSENGTKLAQGNAWGEGAMGQGIQDALAFMSEATGTLLADPAAFTGKEAYTQSTELADPALVASSGLKKFNPQDTVQLAKIATAEGLDAVIVVKNNWMIQQAAEETKDANGVASRQQWGVAEVDISMVNAAGVVVAEFKDTCRDVLENPDRSFEQRGEIRVEDSGQLLLNATRVCLKRFTESFRGKWPATTPVRNIEDVKKAKEEAEAKAKEEAAAAAKAAEEEAAKKAAEEKAAEEKAAKGKKGKKKK